MKSAQDFASPEGLRLLLVRLTYSGPSAWETDPEATDLMAYTMERYGALARKHGLEPTDAAVAAFHVMCTRAARVAEDPWAVITHAVQLSLIYEARAQGLLCSPQQARRTALVGCHDAERFSDRASELADYHPALRVEDDLPDIGGPRDPDVEDAPSNAYVALDEAVSMFVELGWPDRVARLCVEYVCSRLIRTGNRVSAFESLRRDRHATVLLDIDQESWLDVIRALLGTPNPDLAHTSAGRGILLRLLIGERVDELFTGAVADAITAAAPRVTGRSHA